MRTKLTQLLKKKVTDQLGRVAILMILLSLVASVNQSQAQNWEELQKIVASDRAGGDLFGCSVSIDGDYAIVGARQVYDDDNGINLMPSAGAAYLFERDGNNDWLEVQKIVASDRDTTDRFGWSVAISGNYAIVGAPMEDHDVSGNNELNDAGSAYFFERDGNGDWQEVQKVVASDRHSLDNFGWSVAISGNYAIVGAVYEDEDAGGGNTISSSGSAYVFERDGNGDWQQVDKIVASDRGTADDRFGESVSISGSYLVVGAWLEDEDARGRKTKNDAGAAYVFERDGNGDWLEVDKIVASDREATDLFGFSVSISGNYALIGARSDGHSGGGNAGSAYVFERNSRGDWKETQKIIASDAAPSDWFGFSVSISGDYAIVSARSEDEDANGNNTLSTAGSAYIFKDDGNGTWIEVNKIVASDRGEGDMFGYRTSISGDYAIVGAYYEDEDENGENTRNIAGSAYIFTKGACPDSDGDGVCDADDICQGHDDNVDTDLDGIPDGCDDCVSEQNAFPEDPLTHTGPNSTSTTYNYGSPGHSDISFVVADLNAKTGGKPDTRYIDKLTVSYTDANGPHTYGTFGGDNYNSVTVDIAGPVYTVTLTLEDGYDGEAPGTLSVDPGLISSCPPAPSPLEVKRELMVEASPNKEAIIEESFAADYTDFLVYPNPANDRINVRLNGIEKEALLTIYNDLGRKLWSQEITVGQQSLHYDLQNTSLPSGLYFISLESHGKRITKQLVVIKQ